MKVYVKRNERLSILILLLISLINIVLSQGVYGDWTVKLVEIELLIVYAYVLSSFWKKFGLYDLKTLFLITLGIFSFVNVFLTIFGLEDFMHRKWSVSDFTWENETAVNVLTYYILFLSIYYTICLTKKQKPQGESIKSVPKSNVALLNLCKKMFYFSLPFAYAYRVLYAYAVIRSGYTSIYNHTAAVSGPIFSLLNIFVYIFTISYYVICMEETNGKLFTRYSIFYLIYTVIQFAQGSRAQALCTVIFILFYRYVVYGLEFKFAKLVILLFAGLPIIYTIGQTRLGVDVSGFNIIQRISNLTSDLSGSISVAGYYYQNRAALSHNTYPYVLEPVLRLYLFMRYPTIMRSGQSTDMLAIRYNLGHQMTNNISSIYYLNGYGVDSSFIAEFSEFGIIGVIIGSILISIVISVYSRNIVSSKYLKFFAPIFVQYILMIPRAPAIFDTYTLVKWSVVYLAVIGLGKLLRKGKRTEPFLMPRAQYGSETND